MKQSGMGEGDREAVEGAGFVTPFSIRLRRVSRGRRARGGRPLHHFVVPLPRFAEEDPLRRRPYRLS
jgi:hypothetical protein